LTAGSQLAQAALFRGSGAVAVSEIADRAFPARFAKGAMIFGQGEAARHCYVVTTGAVKIATCNEDGREVVLAVLGPGDVFGELALFDDTRRCADAIAVEDTALLSIPKHVVRGVCKRHPAFALALLRTLSARLRDTNETVRDAVFFDITGRVARRLAGLAEAHGSPAPGGTRIDIAVSQAELANMVGASRESVNKAVTALTRQGLLSRSRDGRYVVADLTALRERES
jgi:CRP/FNR family transcriptional regulator